MNYANPLEALEAITAPSKRGDGWRHGWLGDSGMGKTNGNKWLVSYALEKECAQLALSLDDKSNWYAQYQGTYRTNPDDLRKRPPVGNEPTNHIVFRGVAITRNFADACSAEDVAKCAQEMVGSSRCMVLVNIDELADATNGGQAWKKEEREARESRIAQIFRKGRGVGLSITWTTQVPQSLPREAFALSDTIGIYRLSGREVEYLLSKHVITPELASIIPTLQIGDWVLYNKAQGAWNGKIYRLPLWQ